MVKRTGLLFPFILFFCGKVLFADTPPSPKIVKIYSTHSGGFAGIKDDGTITAWGKTSYGGSLPSAVSTALAEKQVTDIFSNNCAFAALTSDGMVVSWGGTECGGDSSAVATELASGVTKVLGNKGQGSIYWKGAFAALKSDGSVVTWGYSGNGGSTSRAASQLTSGVTDIVSSYFGFSALKDDGSVVTWGRGKSGNFISNIGVILRERDVSLLLQGGVSKIFSSGFSFVALKEDGRVVGWNEKYPSGRDTLAISHNLEYATSKIVSIIATGDAFAALKDDNSLLVWGDPNWGGNDGPVRRHLQSNVSGVYASKNAFAALKTDGSVITWGDEGGLQGGVPSEYSWVKGGTSNHAVHSNLRVTKIFPGWYAFAAIKVDGSVVTWGRRSTGANTAAAIAAVGTGRVASIVPSRYSFAALKEDGSVATWGSANFGGDSSSVSSSLGSGVVQVVGSYRHFSALKNDGSIVIWPSIN